MMDAGFLRVFLGYSLNFLALIPMCLIFTRVFDEGSVNVGRILTSGAWIELGKKMPKMTLTASAWLTRVMLRFRRGNLGQEESDAAELLSANKEEIV